MPRVAPEEGAEPPHHHTPNRAHYKDVAHGKDKNTLVDFEKYAVKDSTADENANTEDEERSSSKRRRRRSQSQRREPRAYPPAEEERPRSEGQRYPPPDYAYEAGPPRKKRAKGSPGKFIQCDLLTVVVILVYILAIMITALAIYCYREDSIWNSIVHNRRSFPAIEGESFFANKYLYFPDAEPQYVTAKKHMVRENRWFEIMHMMFMVAFLILTVFQLTAYVTRGDEDHARIFICYYTIFGGLGLIIALFPLVSWHNQHENYKKAGTHLHSGSRKIWTNGPTGPGISNATANDAYLLARIMHFCFYNSEEGITFDTDIAFEPIYGKKYRMPTFQELGFCTNYKFKIINTILTTIFALLCCIIPCIYCFADQENEKELAEERAAMAAARRQELRQAMQQQRPPPPPSRPQYDEEEAVAVDEDRRERKEKRRQRREQRRRNTQTLDELSGYEREEIEKFREYIENDDEMDEN